MAKPTNLVACRYIHCFWRVILLRGHLIGRIWLLARTYYTIEKGGLVERVRKAEEEGGREGEGKTWNCSWSSKMQSLTSYIQYVLMIPMQWGSPFPSFHGSPKAGPSIPLHILPSDLDTASLPWEANSRMSHIKLGPFQDRKFVRCNYFVALSSAKTVHKFTIKGEEICWQYCISVPLVAVYPVKRTSLLCY